MDEVTIEIKDNQEIWQLIDKSISYIFIHRLNPNETIEWWTTSLKTKDGKELKDILVRQMEFDMLTDLNGLKPILDLNINQIGIYQFDSPVPDTLDFEYLPEKSKEQILKQNGLRHSFLIDFEFVTIKSFDSGFIESIRKNLIFENRIK